MILRLVFTPMWLEHHVTIIPRLLPIIIIIPHQTHILLILLLIPRQPPLTRHLPPLSLCNLHRLIIITITNRSCWFSEKVFN